MEYKYDFDDLVIVPAPVSTIESRSDVKILDENNMLPIFAAPMDTVVNDINKDLFIDNKIYTISNRTEGKIYSKDKFNWCAVGFNDFEDNYLKKDIRQYGEKDTYYVLIDVANGHQKKLHDFVKLSKEKYGSQLVLMVGNIANPETYRILSELGSDYIRVGIGGGSGCITSVQTSVGQALASLIKECYEIACTLDNPAKIVADGGIRSYSDIIKSLALGSDMVMCGGVFNKCLESCADTYTQNIKHDNWTEPVSLVDQYDETTINMFNGGTKFFKKFRGMSTKEVQKSLGNKVLKTSEGITRMNTVEYTLEGWVDNFKHYLSSAMSYTNKIDLKSFIGEVEYNLITQNSFKRFNK